jgi:hypothetical protein
LALDAGAISQSVYAAILGMIMITTLIAPLLLRRSCEGELPEEDALSPDVDANAPDYIPTYPLELHE